MVAGSAYETLSPITAGLSKGVGNLEAAASISTHTGTDIINGFITHAGDRGITHFVGHATLTADMGVAAQRADALGINLIDALEKKDVVGIIDTMRIVDKYKITRLLRETGRSAA